MLKNVLILLILLIGCKLNSQTNQHFSGGGGGMQFGYGNIFITQLNKALIKNNLPEFSGSMFTYGGNGHGVINNFIIGGGMYTYNSLDKIKSNTFTASIHSNYGVINVGYIFYSQQKLIGYPLVSLGYSTFSLRLSGNNQISFQEAVTSYNQEIILKKGSPVIDVGWVFEFFPLSKDEKLKGGPCLGLKIGGFFSLIDGTWEYSGGKISNSPKFLPCGLYVRTLYKGYVFH
ncbi:MAG: hypothetical protein JXB17_00325 [Bacteroidales bacterium]|nr:hypothetical protein [Bacteroidales bacterium]